MANPRSAISSSGSFREYIAEAAPASRKSGQEGALSAFLTSLAAEAMILPNEQIRRNPWFLER